MQFYGKENVGFYSASTLISDIQGLQRGGYKIYKYIRGKHIDQM